MTEALTDYNWMIPIAVFLGFMLDQILGDPRSWPHPVVGIGKVISLLDNKLNQGSAWGRRYKGVFLAVSIVSGSYFLPLGIIVAAEMLHPFWGLVVSSYFIFTAIAGKSLLEAGENVLKPLLKRDLDEARRQLSWLVSRDTSRLSQGEIARGTVETLAENFVDGILSPLFYAALGGAPLAMAFKGVSTLDSMVGYKNDRYRDFGWFSARLDDWANYIPARLAVPILLMAGRLKNLPVRRAYNVWRRDASGHPSPNGGNPESVVAGLLGVQLGGGNIYHGKLQYRATMGDALHPIDPKDIQCCYRLIQTATRLSLIPILLLAFITAYIV